MDEHLRTTLADGRTVGYAEYGARGGTPVLFFHGWPASRLQARIVAAAAERRGVRLLALDRPGFGLSDPEPARVLADYPPLVAAFADRLGLARLRIIAVSGGGPYALACASALPERVRAVLVLCCAPPPEVLLANPRLPIGMRLLRAIYRRAPDAIPAVLAVTGWGVRGLPLSPVLRIYAPGLPPPDRAVLADPLKRALVAESTREAFRGGAGGPLRDIQVLMARWAIDLDALGVPVRLLYGDQDTVTPPALCAPVFAGRPGVTLTVRAGEGHYSLPFGHGEAALAELLALAS